MARPLTVMNKMSVFALVGAFGLGGAVGALALLSNSAGNGGSALRPFRPVWTEVPWPFPTDQWGRGRAFLCKPADCGAEVSIYLRAKLGACNCTTGVADDAELDRMSDFDLVGGEVSPLGAGQPITIGSMKGRSRAYTLTGRNPAVKTALSVAFNDRCDMIVATVVLPHDRPATIEPSVIEFLNSRTILRWAEVTLGL
jgi:hypothetical protein